MKRRLVVFLVVSLFSVSTFALPGTNGCPFSCKRAPDLAHCIENYPVRFGNMASCEEIQRCWSWPSGETYCDPPTCRGTQCYDV